MNCICQVYSTQRGRRKKRKRKGGPDNPAQSRKFVEVAKELGLGDKTAEAFGRALDKIVPKKPKG